MGVQGYNPNPKLNPWSFVDGQLALFSVRGYGLRGRGGGGGGWGCGVWGGGGGGGGGGGEGGNPNFTTRSRCASG